MTELKSTAVRAMAKCEKDYKAIRERNVYSWGYSCILCRELLTMQQGKSGKSKFKGYWKA